MMKGLGINEGESALTLAWLGPGQNIQVYILHSTLCILYKIHKDRRTDRIGVIV